MLFQVGFLCNHDPPRQNPTHHRQLQDEYCHHAKFGGRRCFGPLVVERSLLACWPIFEFEKKCRLLGLIVLWR